jgi:hypothetical protein
MVLHQPAGLERLQRWAQRSDPARIGHAIDVVGVASSTAASRFIARTSSVERKERSPRARQPGVPCRCQCRGGWGLHGVISHAGARETLARRGGEPTLMGLPFFSSMVAFAESIVAKHQSLGHTL